MFNPDQRSTDLLHIPVALGAAPHIAATIATQIGNTSMWFYVALMRSLGGKAVFNHQIRLCKSGFHVTVTGFVVVHHVGVHARGNGLGGNAFADHRRAVFHGLVHVGYMRQWLVIDLDRLGCILGRQQRSRGDRGHRMAVIQGLFTRHNVFKDVPVFTLQPFGEIRACDDALDAFHAQGRIHMDRLDLGMCVGRTHDDRMQHARHHHISAVVGAAGYLVDPVGAIGARADNFEIAGLCFIKSHYAVSRISAAASITARMILSYPVQRHRLPASQ